jgi:hypothetical protein
LEKKRPETSIYELNPWYEKKVRDKINSYSLEAAYFTGKAKLLQKQLDGMIRQQKEDLHWLNTLNHIIASYAQKKQDVSYKWLSFQQSLAEKKLLKFGILTQAKLKMEIVLSKAKASASKSLCRELKSCMKKQ